MQMYAMGCINLAGSACFCVGSGVGWGMYETCVVVTTAQHRQYSYYRPGGAVQERCEVQQAMQFFRSSRCTACLVISRQVWVFVVGGEGVKPWAALQHTIG